MNLDECGDEDGKEMVVECFLPHLSLGREDNEGLTTDDNILLFDFDITQVKTTKQKMKTLDLISLRPLLEQLYSKTS